MTYFVFSYELSKAKQLSLHDFKKNILLNCFKKQESISNSKKNPESLTRNRNTLISKGKNLQTKINAPPTLVKNSHLQLIN